MRHRLMTHPRFLYLLLLPPRFYSLPPNKIKHYYSVAANKITYEDEGEIVRDGLKIEIRPAWKWVLEG